MNCCGSHPQKSQQNNNPPPAEKSDGEVEHKSGTVKKILGAILVFAMVAGLVYSLI